MPKVYGPVYTGRMALKHTKWTCTMHMQPLAWFNASLTIVYLRTDVSHPRCVAFLAVKGYCHVKRAFIYEFLFGQDSVVRLATQNRDGAMDSMDGMPVGHK
eukprot:scaffold288187_cov17-Prasinocladus_malaysianus.AAC.1